MTSDNRKAVAEADIVLLCTKPQVIREVLEEIRPHLGEKALVISGASSAHQLHRAAPGPECSGRAGDA